MGHLVRRIFTRSKKLSVGRSVIGLVSLLVVLGCGGTGIEADCCPLIFVNSQVIVQGTTMEADGSPVSGSAVAADDTFTYDCTTELNTLYGEPPVALSDTDGFFQLRLETTSGAGLHCITLTARHPDGIQVDTLRDVEMRFRRFFEPFAEIPDTVFLEVVFGG